MDEQAIRMWAWDKTSNFIMADGSNTTHQTRLGWADDIAAWVMSGKLPPPEPSA